MPTVLLINSSCNYGSTGRIVENIGRLAQTRGYISYMSYGRDFQPSELHVIKIGNKLSNYIHVMFSRVLDNHGLMSKGPTQKLVGIIKTINPEIVHLHNIHGYYLNYKVLFDYLNTTNIKVLWTLHDCWPFTGHCAHFVTAGCEKWKTECYDCPLINDYPKAFFDNSKRNFGLKKRLFTSNNDMHLVAASEWLANLARQSFLGNKEIRVIHNGIDLGQFRPVTKENKTKFRILGVSGVWYKEKGLYDFFKLNELIDKRSCEIVLIGLNGKQIEELPKGIIGVKSTSSIEELVGYYSSADVFLNMTYADTFPTVNLESLACGTPVITYMTGGSPEAVSDDTGWVVKQGDIDSVVVIINEIISQTSSEREKQRVKCRQRAEAFFDKDKSYKKYLDIYDELLKGQG